MLGRRLPKASGTASPPARPTALLNCQWPPPPSPPRLLRGPCLSYALNVPELIVKSQESALAGARFAAKTARVLRCFAYRSWIHLHALAQSETERRAFSIDFAAREVLTGLHVCPGSKADVAGGKLAGANNALSGQFAVATTMSAGGGETCIFNTWRSAISAKAPRQFESTSPRNTTVFVGANNSGKTSAMVALRHFLVDRTRVLESMTSRCLTGQNLMQRQLDWEKHVPGVRGAHVRLGSRFTASRCLAQRPNG